MWEQKNKEKLTYASIFRIENLKSLRSAQKKVTKDSFSAMKIFARVGKTYNQQRLESLTNKFPRIVDAIENVINENPNSDPKLDPLKSLKGFCESIKNKDFKKACDFSTGALKNLESLNCKYKVNHLRNFYYDDLLHILAASSFRRLQDKAQVYSLEQSDYPRTRLTHSCEVGETAECVAASINFELSNNRSFKEADAKYGYTYKNNENIKLICRCAGLLHDIGNPPFGHFGEDVINDYFSGLYQNDTYGIKSTIHNEQMISDLTSFDGNAQGFRIACKLQYFSNKKGLNLPASILLAMLKYPFNSCKYPKANKKKIGYFYTENDVIEIMEILGSYKENVRSPLSLIMEVADDISYVTADIEDAIHKGYITFEDFYSLRELDDVCKDFYESIEEKYKENLKTYKKKAFEITMRTCLSELRTRLIDDAANTFDECKNQIFNIGCDFSFNEEKKEVEHFEISTASKNYKTLYDSMKRIMKSVYSNNDINKVELRGKTILKFLLDNFCNALLADLDDDKFEDGELKSKLRGKQKWIDLISNDFINTLFDDYNIYKDHSNHDELKKYLLIRLIIDYISGMTDSYAQELYNEINGGK